MKFDGEFSTEEKEEILSMHAWMEKYYLPLVGAKVKNVSISVSDPPNLQAFPCIEFELVNGRVLRTEITSVDDFNTPGCILGISVEESTV